MGTVTWAVEVLQAGQDLQRHMAASDLSLDWNLDLAVHGQPVQLNQPCLFLPVAVLLNDSH